MYLGAARSSGVCSVSYTHLDVYKRQRLGYRMMALEVDDMHAALDALKDKGVECTWGPLVRPAYARAEIRDPDGNSIELRQWIDGR